MAPVIRLVRPILPDMSRVGEHLEESFAARRLSNFGPAVRRLEGVLDRRFGFRGAVLTSSGHTAIEAAVATSTASTWAIPAFTFESTRLAVRGKEVVYVDVDQYGFIDLNKLRDVDFDGVIAVCPLSCIPDLTALREVVGEREIVVDAAATFGSSVVFDEVAGVSFHATKTLPIGEGGTVFGLHTERREAVLRYINFGLDASGTPTGTGTNAKMSDYAAAVGLALIDGPLEAEVTARLRNAHIYRELLGSIVPPSLVGDRTVYQVLPVFLPTAEAADRVRQKLRDAGVECRQYYRPLVPLQGAVSCYERNICLPVHGGLDLSDIEMICSIVTEI